MAYLKQIHLQDLTFASQITDVNVGSLIQFEDKMANSPCVGLRCKTELMRPASRGVVALSGPNVGVFYTDGELNHGPVILIDKIASIVVEDPSPRLNGLDRPQPGYFYCVNDEDEKNSFATAVFFGNGSFFSYLILNGERKGFVEHVSVSRLYVGKVGFATNDATVRVDR